jgi:LacI family transcriptional regulator
MRVPSPRAAAQDAGLTAIFAMSDEMGAAVVNELQRRGHRVPEDVSVLGFDNTSTSRHVNPPLSTMAQPLEDMGRMAAKKLLRYRNLGPKVMPHRLIERGSASCLS